MRLVGFENIKSAQGLVDDVQRLELFGFADLFVEPALDFILCLFGQLLMDVVDVSVQLKQGDHFLLTDWANESVVVGADGLAAAIGRTGQADIGHEVLRNMGKRGGG